MRQPYGDNHGVQLLMRLAAEGLFVFTTTDARRFSRALGVADGYLSQLLSRLEGAGWIRRLRRGLYAGTGKLPGQASVHPFVIATRLVSPAAISHWSALHYHGFTEQIPLSVMATTPKKVVTPSMRITSHGSSPVPGAMKHAWEIGCSRYEYVCVKPEHFFGTEDVWIDEHFRVTITDRERTLLDGFVSPRLFGGMGEVLAILDEIFPSLNLDHLVDHCIRFGKGSVAKRLGWSLEKLGVRANILSPLLELPVSGYRILDPTRPAGGSYDGRWMLRVNLSPSPVT